MLGLLRVWWTNSFTASWASQYLLSKQNTKLSLYLFSSCSSCFLIVGCASPRTYSLFFSTLPLVLLKVPTGFSHLSSSEKKRYRESYISDTLDMDLDPCDKNSRGSGSSGGSRRDNRLSRQSTGSHGSSHTSGIEADSRHRVSVEMSVDEPFSIDRVHRKEKSCSSTISYGSSGIDSGSKGRAEDDSQDDGKEF